MNMAMKRILNITAACFSLISGLLWALSAKTQMGILNSTDTNAAEIATKLNYLSQHENLWAAWGAAGAGIALFLALLFE